MVVNGITQTFIVFSKSSGDIESATRDMQPGESIRGRGRHRRNKQTKVSSFVCRSYKEVCHVTQIELRLTFSLRFILFSPIRTLNLPHTDVYLTERARQASPPPGTSICRVEAC